MTSVCKCVIIKLSSEIGMDPKSGNLRSLAGFLKMSSNTKQ